MAIVLHQWRKETSDKCLLEHLGEIMYETFSYLPAGFITQLARHFHPRVVGKFQEEEASSKIGAVCSKVFNL